MGMSEGFWKGGGKRVLGRRPSRGGIDSKGRCVKPNVFGTLPNLTRLTNLTNLGPRDTSEKVIGILRSGTSVRTVSCLSYRSHYACSCGLLRTVVIKLQPYRITMQLNVPCIIAKVRKSL